LLGAHPSGGHVQSRARKLCESKSGPRGAELLYGDRDVRAPLNVAEDLHAKIPRSSLVVVSGAGHIVNIEAAQRFNAEVRRFLMSVRTNQ
jgi:hypothetical protein